MLRPSIHDLIIGMSRKACIINGPDTSKCMYNEYLIRSFALISYWVELNRVFTISTDLVTLLILKFMSFVWTMRLIYNVTVLQITFPINRYSERNGNVK